MRLVPWTLALAGVGLVVSRWASTTFARGATLRLAWLAGLPALAPAWLVAFISLLGEAGSAQGAPRPAFLGASAAAILGVIASDALFVREERRPTGPRPFVCWLLGVGALVPAWLVALLLATRLGR